MCLCFCNMSYCLKYVGQVIFLFFFQPSACATVQNWPKAARRGRTHSMSWLQAAGTHVPPICLQPALTTRPSTPQIDPPHPPTTNPTSGHLCINVLSHRNISAYWKQPFGRPLTKAFPCVCAQVEVSRIEEAAPPSLPDSTPPPTSQ